MLPEDERKAISDTPYIDGKVLAIFDWASSDPISPSPVAMESTPELMIGSSRQERRQTSIRGSASMSLGLTTYHCHHP